MTDTTVVMCARRC